MNYIDTRDLYERQQELQGELDGLKGVMEDTQLQLVGASGKHKIASLQAMLDEAEAELTEWDSEHGEELEALNALESDIGSEWMHGVTLIPVDDFVEYAQEFAEDIGAIARDLSWPSYCIDWEWAARDLAMDYSICTYNGVDYYFMA